MTSWHTCIGTVARSSVERIAKRRGARVVGLQLPVTRRVCVLGRTSQRTVGLGGCGVGRAQQGTAVHCDGHRGVGGAVE